MPGVQVVDDESKAAALADLLNGDTRTRPVVVVTIPSGRETPWIDVHEIEREAGALAEVYVMPTGAITWEFSRRMAEGAQVYGGAGRVYPVGHEWAADLSQSPLRFAFNVRDGERATQYLVSDLLRMAVSAGLLQRPAEQLRQVDGVVKWIVAGRALVELDSRLTATVAEELTAPDVPLDRILAPKQRVHGLYDAQTRRLDVRDSLRSPGEALARYAVGDVVLTRVTRVEPESAELMLYPKTAAPAAVVTVRLDDVTGNPADTLDALMTPGEVIPARIRATGPSWELVLHDVDDDEPVVPAPPLLPGGPPWLVEDEQVLHHDEPTVLVPPPPQPVEMPPASPAPATAVPPTPSPPATPPRPSPLIFGRRGAGAAQTPRPQPPAEPQVSASTQELLLRIAGHQAEATGLKRQLKQTQDELQAAADDREQLRYLLGQAQREAHRAENELKAARARLRKAGKGKAAAPAAEGPRFADPEQGFRYLVLTRWATRTSPGEQGTRPLPEYAVGPRFLESVERLEGINPDKVADVVFEIVTGLAPDLPGRAVHRLRTGAGGDDPVRSREDGAVAWRASLQVHTPSARRIHYWVRPDGVIELARVSTHDDYET